MYEDLELWTVDAKMATLTDDKRFKVSKENPGEDMYL